MAVGQTDGYFDMENTFKVLVATDVHLGYKHLDPIMANDAMNTFREVLQLAHEQQVDFVLLGGDLFHHNTPPRHVLYDCSQLLKQYCVGTREPTFEVEETDEVVTPQFEKNWNISLPVFSIHGNHDEPTGPQCLSVMDLLHSSGLIRYFGKTSLVEDKIQVKPVLLRKGSTKLALYGIGSIRSNKLQQMFRNQGVSLDRPRQDPEDWFNVLVLHQNHVRRPDNTEVEEASIHGFLDLVIWGHEHESKLRPRKTRGTGGGEYWLSQPGSTIATQFKKSEMGQKHVGLLTVRGRHFDLKPIPLQTVRQMYIVDHDPYMFPGESDQDERVERRLIEDCRNKVERLLEEAEHSRGPRQPKEPLIRIKIQQQDHVIGCSNFRFGNPFKDKVANADSILVFGRKMDWDEDAYSGFSFPRNPHSPMPSIEELVLEELRKKSIELHVLSLEEMEQAVKDFVVVLEKLNIKGVVEKRLETVRSQLKHDLTTSSRRYSGSSYGSGRLSGYTGSGDSDVEFYREIDTLCRQLFRKDQAVHTLQSTTDGGHLDNSSKDVHGVTVEDAIEVISSEDEDWLQTAEDEFFRAPSKLSQTTGTPFNTSEDTWQRHAGPQRTLTSFAPRYTPGFQEARSSVSDHYHFAPSATMSSSTKPMTCSLPATVDQMASRNWMETSSSAGFQIASSSSMDFKNTASKDSNRTSSSSEVARSLSCGAVRPAIGTLRSESSWPPGRSPCKRPRLSEPSTKMTGK